MEYVSLSQLISKMSVFNRRGYDIALLCETVPSSFGLTVTTLLKPEKKRKSPEKFEGILGDGTLFTDVKCLKVFRSQEFRAVPARPSVEVGLVGR